MLLVVSGASGSGKTTAFRALRPALGCRSAELDQIGVPPDADTAWRQRATEAWIGAALAAPGRDLVLFGQVAPGEVLAAPSAERLDATTLCLLHCDPLTRRRRLLARGLGSDDSANHLAFGEWMQRHARDPNYRPDVIRAGGWGQMRWERWAGWSAGDPRWRFDVLDTRSITPEAMARRVLAWISTSFARRDELPLRGRWWLR